jgi:hypothetical protein
MDEVKSRNERKEKKRKKLITRTDEVDPAVL